MPRLSRRRFLSAIVVTAAASALPLAALAGATGKPPTVSRTRFPQSVASGDPRPDRVLLWTRVAGNASGLRVQVAEDAGFSRCVVDRGLPASTGSDGCIKVRVQGLRPGTRYHYRFLVDEPGGVASSPVGRTRTAPAPDADVPVKLAFVCCQDYGGRWYNTLLPLQDEDLDFVLHLGDFIYETAGDPSFQSSTGERRIVFDDLDGALRLGSGDGTYYAARSLSNYRQLHRSYRTDPMLQRLLETTPLVAIWDDHEFSDDCWQDTGTYADGRRDERDGERRRNAEQAYFEYMPVDVEPDLGDDALLPVARERLFPHVRMWRRLRFGKAVDLLLTDYRSGRPDHLIPEDAFPGALIADADALARDLPRIGMTPEQAAPLLMPYLDLADPQHAKLSKATNRALAHAYRQAGQPPDEADRRAARAAAAPIALPVLERVLAGYNAAVPFFMQVKPPSADGLPRGFAWLAVGKTELFGDIGSRYLVTRQGFDLLAALRALDAGAPSPYAPEQRAWLAEQVRQGDARFRVYASSVSFTSLVLDLSDPALGAPEPMRRAFYLNVDQWDGFPRERRRLLDEVFAPAGGTIVLSGDIHSGFATQHGASVVEFTAPAISSETLSAMLAHNSGGSPERAEAGRRLADHLEAVVSAGNPALRYAQTRRHGVGVLRIDGEHATAEFLELPAELCAQCLYEQPEQVRAHLQVRRFALDRADMQLRDG